MHRMGAIARIDYRYGDKLVGQAYLEATVTQGYVPGAVNQSTDTAETETVAETIPSKAPDKETEPSSKKIGAAIRHPGPPLLLSALLRKS